MAQAIITLKIMPESPDVDLHQVQHAAERLIDGFCGEKGEKRFAIEPVAFGLKSLKITFVADEAKGGTDDLEAQIAKVEGVNSVECVDVRRAVG